MAKTADQEGPECGHTFRLIFESKGSHRVGVGEYHDVRDFTGPAYEVEVRAWDLREALRKAAELPFETLVGTESRFIRLGNNECLYCKGVGSDPMYGNDVPCSACGGTGRVSD